MNILRAFYAFAIGSGVITILNNFNNLIDIKILVSIIGIVAGILFFLKKYNFYYITLIWIIIQIPYLNMGGNEIDPSLLYSIHFSLNFGDTAIGVNAHIFLLFFAKYIILSQYLEKEIRVKPYTEKSKDLIGEEIVFKPIDVFSNKSLRADLNLNLNGVEYSKLLFQPKDVERIKKGMVILFPKNEGNKIKATIVFEEK